MKRTLQAALAGAVLLTGCSTMGAPYIKGETGCDEIIDQRERLDCLERVDRAERDWRAEKRKESEDKKKKSGE